MTMKANECHNTRKEIWHHFTNVFIKDLLLKTELKSNSS